ncbi:MAG: DinB family protein, partial [Anaerolineaceae bacterium]|nr:DinB family protein [Anaerolineaceae bacterium]
KLLSDLEKSQEIITTALENILPEKLDEMIGEDEGKRSVKDLVIFYLWHETYHVGQLELLRQLSGVNDAVP